MKIKFHAIVAQLEKPGQWNLVGLYIPGMGHMPAINQKREVIDQAWKMVAPEVKSKGAKIVTLEGEA